ncbi:GtrA family protein [Sinosporangium album]|uniref:GtrA family protein n=1 Tax=Sinosporangium album TaxID=504805 RepID=UPI001C4095E2|nr:GtrA family protein [Sinosporangium album]
MTGELAKFGVVGAIAFIISVPGANVFRYVLDFGPLTSVVVATLIGTAFAFLANRFWTWRHAERSGLAQEFFLFVVFNAIALLMQLLCVGFTEYTLKLSNPIALNVANLAGVGLGTLFRFWSYKKWVFRAPAATGVRPEREKASVGPPK